MGTRSKTNMNSRLNLVVNQVFNSRPFSPAPNVQLSDILLALKEKSVDELNCLLTDKNSYNSFLHSLESVRHLNLLRLELIKGNADLARNNLAKDSQIAELRNQCTIIRTSELATAREKFEEVQKSEKEISAIYSPSMLLSRLRETATKVDEAAERLQCKLLASDIDLSEFIYHYRKERILYHTQMLVHIAAKTSMDALSL